MEDEPKMGMSFAQKFCLMESLDFLPSSFCCEYRKKIQRDIILKEVLRGMISVLVDWKIKVMRCGGVIVALDGPLKTSYFWKKVFKEFC